MDWLRLLRSHRVGPATFLKLLETHESAGAALDALPEIARAAGNEGYVPCSAARAREELDAGHAAGAVPLALGAPDYPAALSDLPDPPPLLWAVGRLEMLERPGVAIVGARNASSLGLRMARGLARDLGREGQVVISGLARGIDAAAHAEALGSGTIAVLGGGVDVIYPAENACLFHDIGDEGLRLSEQPMGLVPQARHFPRRNRLISGLARAVIVVEAAARSGSLITARDALDQGREVLAVPGHPLDARAAGCNMLIRDGAVLLRGTRDLEEALALPGRAARRRGITLPQDSAFDGPRDPVQAGAQWPDADPPDGIAPSGRAPARTREGSRPREGQPVRSGPLGLPTGAAGLPAVPSSPKRGDASPHGAGTQYPAERDISDTDDTRREEDGTHATMTCAPCGDTLAARVLHHLGPSPTQEDELIRDLRVSPAELAPSLLTLELEGRIERQPGGLLVRTD